MSLTSFGPLGRFVALALTLSAFSPVACGGAPEPAPAAPAPPVASSEVKVGGAPAVVTEEGGPVPISSADPSWGSRTALVTIVELADFQCPFCARGSATIEALRRAYGPDKIRVVWKHMPLEFHPEARPAAEAAAAVMAAGGSDAFWKFHDKAFANQMMLSSSSYEEWAKDAGVDPAKFRATLASGAPKAKVDADATLAKQIGVLGTPAFFINGIPLLGAQPIEAFKSTIDLELSKARTKLGSGVAPDKLYATLAAENFKKPSYGDEEEDQAPDKNVYRVPVDKSPVRGAPGALVTVVVFSDFQCPFCKRAEATLSELESRYPSTLRFVWKNLPLPFHKRAEPAAELALEARAQKGDAGFWAAHKKLFESQPELEDADLERIAKELSLDVGKAMAAVRTHKYKASIDADMALGDDFKAEGTPHFFINGKRVVGAVPAAEFSAVIDEELARAKAAVAKGVAPKDVYDAVTKDGLGAPEPETAKIALAPGAPVLGAAKAPVSIYVFSDFQCPFCKRVEPTLAELRKTYGTKIRFVWKNMPLPFHPNAHIAAEAAMEAQAQKGDAAFWKMHDTLFEHQEPGGLERSALETYAKTLGLDAAKFAAALDSGKHKQRVDDEAQAASRAGISGTPTFVIVAEGSAAARATPDSITGYLLSGAQPINRFKKLIDRALSDAKAKAPAPPTATKPSLLEGSR